MHGRPRTAPKPEDAVASAAKAETLRSLQAQFLYNHRKFIYTKEALDLSAKLLETNPECYTAWNYRKLGIEHTLSQSSSDPDSVKSILDEELRVVESALRQNFKSYGAWHHRKWVLSKGQSSIDHELRLLDKFQKADPRNFHAWNYRRFIAALLNRSDEDELKYTTDMINTNFSNYSAWHNRSVLLSHLLEKRVQRGLLKEDALAEEFALIHQAIFTDPDDQSGWFYHLWLFKQTVNSNVPLLVSTWPADSSDVKIDSFLDGHASSLFRSSHEEKRFLLVLYFDQAVEGVNSSTVTVEYAFNSEKELTWTPLSTNSPGIAQAWATYLNFPDEKLNPSEVYSVNVAVGHSLGIISSSSSNSSLPFSFKFTVCLQTSNLEKSESSKRKDKVNISWKDEQFHIYETHLEEQNPFGSFNLLKVNEDLGLGPPKWDIEAILIEISLFRDLLSAIDCKIGKLTLARLLTAYDAMTHYNNENTYKDVHSEEVLQLYSDLMKLDPSHTRYYMDMRSLVLFQQVTSNTKFLLKYCYRFRDLITTSLGNSTCLRLNNLSLSRVGSLEKLLWLQMLDLGHNELRNIEGLEALQLLQCLNLTHNKLGSFSALAPLRLLKELRVLSISRNEIGAHTVDTRRYLRAPPFPSLRALGTVNAIANGDIGVAAAYLEAFLIFEGLNLTQLDIAGNAIVDERFKSFLVGALHSLRWLDGEELH